MSVIDPNLTQDATLERFTGTGKRGQPTYASPVDIKVRWFRENKLVRTDAGDEQVATARFSTKEDVGVGDRVTDWKGRQQHVIQVRENFNVAGAFEHNVAWCK